MKELMTTGSTLLDYKLVTFNKNSGYKVISGYRCYYETESLKNAIKYWNKHIKRKVTR